MDGTDPVQRLDEALMIAEFALSSMASVPAAAARSCATAPNRHTNRWNERVSRQTGRLPEIGSMLPSHYLPYFATISQIRWMPSRQP